MIQTTVQVSGMACSMCEAHVNDAVRNALSIQKVTSSHGKGETVILSDEPLDADKLREAIKIHQTGDHDFDKIRAVRPLLSNHGGILG